MTMEHFLSTQCMTAFCSRCQTTNYEHSNLEPGSSEYYGRCLNCGDYIVFRSSETSSSEQDGGPSEKPRSRKKSKTG